MYKLVFQHDGDELYIVAHTFSIIIAKRKILICFPRRTIVRSYSAAAVSVIGGISFFQLAAPIE